MSSTWEYIGNHNGIIKKIFCIEIKSTPIKYKWTVILNDNLHVRLDDESLDKLNLTDIEKQSLLDGRINARKLAEKNSKKYEEYI
jgi:hypothetical protein